MSAGATVVKNILHMLALFSRFLRVRALPVYFACSAKYCAFGKWQMGVFNSVQSA